MSKKRHKPRFHRQTAPGAAPGVVKVDPESPSPVIHVIAFGCNDLREIQIVDPSEIVTLREKWPVVWVNVDGLGDARTISRLGEIFGLHRLALEDVVNVHQRAKVEDYSDHLFIVARMVTWNGRLETEQVSLFLGCNFVVTFQESLPGDSFDPVRARLRQVAGAIRSAGADYLAYALLDAVVDGYFPLLEDYGERLDGLEDEILAGMDHEACIAKVHQIKRDLRYLRRAVWPHREAIHSLARDPTPLISPETRLYLRDCYDHTIQIIDLLETDRELGSDLTDLYLSHLSQRTNEVMKVLTIITTIFIPLSFIAGVYGMNFDPESSPWNMPELRSYWGYPVTLLVMALATVGLLIWFRRKGWLGQRRRIISGIGDQESGSGNDVTADSAV